MNRVVIEGFLSKFKKDKKSMLILGLAICGIILVLLPDASDDENSEASYENNFSFLSQDELCCELENFIENINGAGKTKVILTFESTAENVFAFDETISSDSDGESEINREYIVVDTSGMESGIKIKVISPKVRGIAVVCEGAGNPIIKEQIVLSLSALFDISSNNISIAEMAQ